MAPLGIASPAGSLWPNRWSSSGRRHHGNAARRGPRCSWYGTARPKDLARYGTRNEIDFTGQGKTCPVFFAQAGASAGKQESVVDRSVTMSPKRSRRFGNALSAWRWWLTSEHVTNSTRDSTAGKANAKISNY